ATSTGGMTGKRYGRVGDVPVIGAGNYADNSSCAVSGTGHGEYFIRYNVASDICARVKYLGISAAEAAEQVVHGDMFAAGGTGGVIVVDAKGDISWTFNTQGMYRAKRSNTQDTVTAIFADSEQ
ncbi:MAG: isoaspartyl peptidase/L-asparaginase, partial [Alkalimonas sp.]|nr:isoaspartyl peptidase/L-asparaginase [Alkalimonas sp.]